MKKSYKKVHCNTFFTNLSKDNCVMNNFLPFPFVNNRPPWMELDSLYQFKIESKENIGKGKKGLKMAECIEVFEKDMS